MLVFVGFVGLVLSFFSGTREGRDGWEYNMSKKGEPTKTSSGRSSCMEA